MIATLTWVLIGLSIVASIVIIALTAYAVLHRNERVRSYDEASDRTSIRWIVIGGAAIPGILLIGVFVVTLLTMNALTPQPPTSGMVIELVGRQWWWEVRYTDAERPQASFASANEIHIPVGTRVPVQLQSVDVVHSFWAPELQGKIDLIPGRRTHTWLHADEPGVYRAVCAEYCGLQHARMALNVIAHEPAEFEAWLARASGPAEPEPRGEAAAQHAAHGHTPEAREGQRIFLDSGCGFCHTVRGTPARGRLGPDLTHIGSRVELAAGTVPNTRGHMSGWIANPQGIKPGAHMPRMSLRPDELHALVGYLLSLH